MDTDDILSVVNHDVELRPPVSEEQELEAIHQLEDYLRRDFPTVAAETVDEIVETHYHELDDRPIRDYVFVLVEHAAKADLMALSH